MNYKKQFKIYKSGQRGFTLVELLLVLVILALIAGLVLPGIIGKAESAKAKAASSQISRISMSVESFYLDTGNISCENIVNEICKSSQKVSMRLRCSGSNCHIIII